MIHLICPGAKKIHGHLLLAKRLYNKQEYLLHANSEASHRLLELPNQLRHLFLRFQIRESLTVLRVAEKMPVLVRTRTLSVALNVAPAFAEVLVVRFTRVCVPWSVFDLEPDSSGRLAAIHQLH